MLIPRSQNLVNPMKKTVVMVVMGLSLFAAQAFAQQKTVTGRVTTEQGEPLAGVSILIRGTTTGTTSNSQGTYTLPVAVGQVLQFRYIGTAPETRTVGAENTINVQLRRVAASLDAVVVTALGETAAVRSIGTSQQTVQGSDIAETQRPNFINALQGRVAGVEVTSSSGVPGASSSITIRGVSSISSSNQPLMIIDGLPMDNKTLNTGVLASDAPGSATAFSNRGVDFTNRAADLNPEDIETLVVLKGPEASALYGIDAANGAIIITTKRGKPGRSGMEYSNNFSIQSIKARPETQRVYGPTTADGSLLVLRRAVCAKHHVLRQHRRVLPDRPQQQHNLSFSGGAVENKINYRVATSLLKQEGVIPNSIYDRVNVTGASQAQVTNWLMPTCRWATPTPTTISRTKETTVRSSVCCSGRRPTMQRIS